MTSSAEPGLPVPRSLERSAHFARQNWIDSGVFAVELLCRTMDRADLTGIDVLDVGCGTKIVKTLLDGAMPVGRYVGVDVSADVIDWLDANVSDPRFEFHHLDARNDLYHPEGTPLDEFAELPVGGAQFDLICLFSVFTHLGPDDYVAMLRLLRKHVKPDARLLFSLFIDDYPGLAEALETALNSDDSEVRERTRELIARNVAKQDGFVDAIPDQPLMQARYDKDRALELIDGTGWEVVSLNPPESFIQHYIVCRPT